MIPRQPALEIHRIRRTDGTVGRQLDGRALHKRASCHHDLGIIPRHCPGDRGHAVNALKKNQIKKIIITRPVVEAGEKLGFLPGDLKEKVDPYLIPIYDALYEFMGKENVDKMIEKGIIEVAPLAYMRGRTLDNAMIILDEAQNTTSNQMKMFITRLGFNSKMVITGDVTQIDLPNHIASGLTVATRILTNVPGIAHVQFGKYDVMRHPLVSKIIEKYEENDD